MSDLQLSEEQLAARITTAIRATFNAAAEHFDDGPLSFWEHFGRRTVELAAIEPGSSVLDVCCGTGASALPAAERVTVAGRVVGIDLADQLLDLARAKASERGLENVEFAVGDLAHLDVADGSFDVVICVLGIFFAPDMAAAMAELWKAVKPGGTLAVTTWGRRAFEPANTMYWDAVEAERPDMRPATFPWARIGDPGDLTRFFLDAGTPPPTIVTETLAHPITPEDFWTVVLGSGYRIVLDPMGPEAAGRVRTALRHRMEREQVNELVADLMYARVRKPHPS
jgi:ubiquinone/menaquinone biosynthesis C-methylase UbiE